MLAGRFAWNWAIAATCKAPRQAAEVKQWAVRGSVSRSIRLGAAVIEASSLHNDPIAAILEVETGKMLFSGKVVEVEPRTTEGYLRGRTVLAGLGSARDDRVEVAFQTNGPRSGVTKRLWHRPRN